MRLLSGISVVLLLAAGCGTGEQSSSPTAAQTTTTTEPAVASSVVITTTAPDTTTTSEVATSTTTSSTPTSTSTTTSTIVAAADGHGFAGGTFVAQVDSELGEYRIDDGSLVRLIDENEATFVGEIEVASDGVVHLSVGFEDGWYSCEFVAGSVWRYPADATAPTQPVDLGPGGGVALAPDEGRLAYAAPSECVPDPVEEQFVIAPLDTVVVADLDDGTEQRWTFPAGIDPDLERVRGVGWLSDDALLVMVDGTLLTLDVTSPDVPALDVAVAPVQSGESYLLGIRDGNAVVLTYPGGQRDRRLDLVDPSTGEVVAPLATGQITMAALDASGEHLAVIDDGNLFLDSTEVQVEGHTIDGNVFAVGW